MIVASPALRRCDGHSAVCNHRALELAGITADTPDPAGAAYGRNPDGTPNGMLIESNATDSIAAVIPTPGFEQQTTNLAKLNQHFLERGIVGVGDLMRDLDAVTAANVPAGGETRTATERAVLRMVERHPGQASRPDR